MRMTKEVQTVGMLALKMRMQDQDAEVAQHDEGAEEDDDLKPAQKVRTEARERSETTTLPPFLGNWKVNVEGRQPVDFLVICFPESSLMRLD